MGRMVRFDANAVTLSAQPLVRSPESGGMRGLIVGWSPSSARRLRQWLASHTPTLVDGEFSYTVTLTLADCPATAADFHRLRHRFFLYVQRLGLSRYHWVMEFTRRGVPHLHCFFVVRSKLEAIGIVATWLKITGGALPSQFATPMYDMRGWYQYVSKHVGRSKSHYQRSALPSGWEKSGRVWGHSRAGFHSAPAVTLDDLSRADYFQLRRILNKAARGVARSSGDYRLARRIDRRFNSPVPAISETRPAFRFTDGQNLLESVLPLVSGGYTYTVGSRKNIMNPTVRITGPVVGVTTKHRNRDGVSTPYTLVTVVDAPVLAQVEVKAGQTFGVGDIFDGIVEISAFGGRAFLRQVG